jgi:3-phenylpropionate/trans-cinnamate dioxygenase ferredoxin reductase component
MAEQHQTFVIVGASLTGAKAAQAPGEEGFTGRIVLIGAETERPPLSKGYLTGNDDKAKLYVHHEGWYGENSVELQLARRATSLDRAGRQVELESGGQLGYSKLLLDLARPRVGSDLPGADLDGGTAYARSRAPIGSAKPSAAAAGSSSWVPARSGWRPPPQPEARLWGHRHHAATHTATAAFNPSVGGLVINGFFAQVHRQRGVDVWLGMAVTEFHGVGCRCLASRDAWAQAIQPAGELCPYAQRFFHRHAYCRTPSAERAS